MLIDINDLESVNLFAAILAVLKSIVADQAEHRLSSHSSNLKLLPDDSFLRSGIGCRYGDSLP